MGGEQAKPLRCFLTYITELSRAFSTFVGTLSHLATPSSRIWQRLGSAVALSSLLSRIWLLFDRVALTKLSNRIWLSVGSVLAALWQLATYRVASGYILTDVELTNLPNRIWKPFGRAVALTNLCSRIWQICGLAVAFSSLSCRTWLPFCSRTAFSALRVICATDICFVRTGTRPCLRHSLCT